MDDWHAHSLAAWIWQNGGSPRLMKCSDAEVFLMTAGRNYSWTCKFYIFLVKCLLKHQKLFDFLHFKLRAARSHVAYNWFRVLQKVKTSPQKPPAAWSTFLCLLNCLFCSFDSYGSTWPSNNSTVKDVVHFNCLKCKAIQVSSCIMHCTLLETLNPGPQSVNTDSDRTSSPVLRCHIQPHLTMLKQQN